MWRSYGRNTDNRKNESNSGKLPAYPPYSKQIQYLQHYPVNYEGITQDIVKVPSDLLLWDFELGLLLGELPHELSDLAPALAGRTGFGPLGRGRRGRTRR